MATDFSFFQAHPSGYDFRPLFEAGVAQGKGFADFGEQVASGLLERAKLREAEARRQESARQFNVEQITKGMLANAAIARENRLGAEQQSRDLLQEKRLNLAEDRETRIAQKAQQEQDRMVAFQRAASTGEPASVMAMVPFARTPTEYATLLSTAQSLADRKQKAQDAANVKVQVDQLSTFGRGLAGELARRGVIEPGTQFLYEQSLQSGDLPTIRATVANLLKDQDQAMKIAKDDALRKGEPKRLSKEFDEVLKAEQDAGVKRDPQEVLAIRDRIEELGQSLNEGPELRRELTDVRKLIAGRTKPPAGKPPVDKLNLPNGQGVEDVLGIAKGGRFDEMSPSQQQGLFALGRGYAQQHDPRWGIVEKATQVKLFQAKTPQAKADALEAGRVGLENLSLEAANNIAVINGWKAGGQAQPTPGAPAQSPEDTLRSEVRSGKIKTDAELEARAKELGVTLK